MDTIISLSLGIICLTFLVGCGSNYQKEEIALPNPATVYCKEQGGTTQIRTDPDGSQTGYCILLDKTECEEWKFFRGECK